jgi:hypothetical protein
MGAILTYGSATQSGEDLEDLPRIEAYCLDVV